MQQKENIANQIKELEEQYSEGKWLSFNHISELYLYEYYCKDTAYQLAEYPMNQFYKELGNYYLEEGMYEQANDAYKNAIQWNPVDLDALFAVIEIDKNSGRLEEVKEKTLNLYPYLCTRAMMAHFYRNLGFYYVETYKPDVAVSLYQYGELFFETDNAKKEIAYLEDALNKTFPMGEIRELQQVISKERIPISAPVDTIGLLYEIAKSEEKKNHILSNKKRPKKQDADAHSGER